MFARSSRWSLNLLWHLGLSLIKNMLLWRNCVWDQMPNVWRWRICPISRVWRYSQYWGKMEGKLLHFTWPCHNGRLFKMKKRLTFKPHLTIIITTTTITIVIITIVIITIVIIALVKITKITKITIIIQIFKFINLHVAITVVCQIGTKTAHQPKKTWNGDLLFNHFDELIAYRGPPLVKRSYCSFTCAGLPMFIWQYIYI